MKYIKSYNIISMLVPFFILSCTEPFDLNSIDFEDALIIEAIITNELKHQEIKLSRTFSLEEFNPTEESNAEVIITDDSQNIFEFEEISIGTYGSKIPFGAEPNKNYTLSITTKEGKTYKSQPTQLPVEVPIDNLLASRVNTNNDNENITIFVSNAASLGSLKYFRYEYEETYEIIAPLWVPGEFSFSNSGQLSWNELCCRPLEQKVCYKTEVSESIIQLKTDNLTEGNPSAFPVHIIPIDDPKIRTRYSILVRQYAQSSDAFTFYDILTKSSSSDNLFSQNQPGFFSGNLFSEDNKDEKVVGYFDISSVSSKRIFFNFSDIFPDEPLPPYFEDCSIFQITDMNKLSESVANDEVVFYSLVPDELPNVVNASCGDCTKIGTSLKPDFWID